MQQVLLQYNQVQHKNTHYTRLIHVFVLDLVKEPILIYSSAMNHLIQSILIFVLIVPVTSAELADITQYPKCMQNSI